MITRIIPLIALAALITPNIRAEEDAINITKLNDSLAFLAGLELIHDTDIPLASSSSWKTHIQQMDREFASHEERVLHPMSNWSNEALKPDLTTGSTVRYLFSGPDIIHAFHLFPTADTFIMCGLEPVGETPELTQLNSGNAGRALGEVRNALGEIINFSFFRTKDMKDDLRFSTFHGTTPIMMIFLARSGQYVKGLEYLSLNEDGTLTSQGAKSSGADAVKIDFSPRRVEQTKTLYYFSSDLSNSGFGKTGFETWLEAQPRGNAYLKAASFLMHSSWFSEVRDHLIEYSNQIVEDDSGIPFRYFDTDTWQSSLYGSYNGPIDLFSEYYQPDMRSAYQGGSTALSFGTGYKWRKGESNLMRFVKKSALADAAKAEASETENAQKASTKAPPAEPAKETGGPKVSE